MPLIKNQNLITVMIYTQLYGLKWLLIIIIIIITTRPCDSQKTKKRTCRIVDFDILADHRVKLKESEKRDKYLDLVRELEKKPMEYKSDRDTNCGWYSRYSHQCLVQGLKDFEIRGWIETILTTALLKSARILRRVLRKLAVPKNPVRNHRLALRWKPLKI